MVDEFEEGEDVEPCRRGVEEAVGVGADVPGAEGGHPEGLELEGVVGC